MENFKHTEVTDHYRTSTSNTLDSLIQRRAILRNEIIGIEEAARVKFAETLREALGPVEAALQDTESAIYAHERLLGALPPASPRFQDAEEPGADGSDAGSQSEGETGGEIEQPVTKAA